MHFTCQRGDETTQLMIVPTSTPPVQIDKHIDDNETRRGSDGFGSTGVRTGHVMHSTEIYGLAQSVNTVEIESIAEFRARAS